MLAKEENKSDDYQMIRGPRPWEEPSPELKKQQEELAERGKKFKSPRELGLM